MKTMEIYLTSSNTKMRELTRLLIENPIPEIIWNPDFLKKDRWCEILAVGETVLGPDVLGWDTVNNIRILVAPTTDLVGIFYDSPMKKNFKMFENESSEEIYKFLCKGIQTNWQID